MLFRLFFIFFSTAQLFAMNNIHPQNQAAISVLPTEQKQEIVLWLPFADQQSFVSTCKLLHTTIKPHARSLHIKRSGEICPIFYHSLSNIMGHVGMTFKGTLTGLVALPIIWMAGISAPVLLPIAGGAALGLARSFYKSHQENSTSVKQLAHYTAISTPIAQRIAERTLTADVVHIEYYSNAQAAPLIESAAKGNVPAVVLNVYKGYDQEPLTPLKNLIVDNNKLKRLEVCIIANKTYHYNDLDANDFCEALQKADELEELSLSNINTLNEIFLNNTPLAISKKLNEDTMIMLFQPLLPAILAKKKLKKLSLYCCNTISRDENFIKDLATNDTLEYLSLNRCPLLANDCLLPKLLEFIKCNTQLKYLSLKDSMFSDKGIQQLNASKYKPIHFEVTKIAMDLKEAFHDFLKS